MSRCQGLKQQVCFWNPEDLGVIRMECRLGGAGDEAKGLGLDSENS